MITKEPKIKKYCCFYASDFHLEMILLPYIKDNLKKSNIKILTDQNLSESLKQVLDRTNFRVDEKKEILDLNWDINENNLCNLEENSIVIINGENKYIENINKKIKNLNLKNIKIINCYNINNIEKNKINIEDEYEGIINTNGLN